MLNNPEQFKTVEAALKSMGTIKAFEDENGPILGRVMITTTEIPESVNVPRTDRENLTAFEASSGSRSTAPIRRMGEILYPHTFRTHWR